MHKLYQHEKTSSYRLTNVPLLETGFCRNKVIGVSFNKYMNKICKAVIGMTQASENIFFLESE